MRIKNRIIILCLLTLTLMGSLLILSGCGKKVPEAVSESATTVNVATAAHRDIYGSTRYNGRLKASSEAEVLPKINERIISIYVKEGQEVRAGQTLMTLDSSSLQASIKKAEAQVASTKATQVNNQIKLEAARKKYERTKKLYDAGAAPLSDMENVRDEYDSLQSGAVEAAMAEAQAALLTIQDQVGYCNVTAPVSGIVGRIDVAVGDYVMASTSMAVISDPRQMQIEIMVGESDLSKMKLNNQVDVYVKSVSKDAFTGKVTSIASVLNANSNLYPITITIDNATGKIKSGMYAEVCIDTSSVQKALCVPLSAIIPSDGVNIVYTVNDKKQAKRAEVKTGINDETYVQILSGLKAGDKVVTLGNTLISDGSLLITKSKEGK